MANTFTNNWDDTFPPDTEFAYLYAKNLRDFRTDIQQRMAAISGLDGSKPTFWQDDTTPATGAPAKWNGLLFFATDTSKIYQFQYNSTTPTSSWIDITSNLLPQTMKHSNIVPVSSTATIYTFVFNALLPAQRIRITVNYIEQAVNAGGGGSVVNIGDQSGANQQNIMARGIQTTEPSPGATHTIIIEGGNVADVASQYWTWSDIGVPPANLPAPQHTTHNTATGGAFIVEWLSGASQQSATFYGAMVEFL